MQYAITIETSVGKQLNHIKAKDLTDAIKQVNTYNSKHPDYKMRLCECMPASDNCLMPTVLLSGKIDVYLKRSCQSVKNRHK
jgi:hypothetical protein